MDVSLGAAGASSICTLAAAKESCETPAKEAFVPSRSMMLAAQAAQNVLMPGSQAHIQAASIFVARRLIPPARYTGADREEKKRGEFLHRVKVAKSEAAGQQTQSR